MRSILEEFFYGSISPEVYSLERDSEYKDLMKLITRAEEKLLARLDKDGKELLERYMDTQMELNRLIAIKSQLYGYKLGVLMTAEAFVTGGELVARG